MKKIIIVSILVIFLFVSSGIAGSISIYKDILFCKNTSYQNAAWTIMVYLDGDNNLESNAIDDFNEMAQVGSTSEVNIVVQFDRVYGYDRSHNDWTSTKRFHVAKYMRPTPENALLDIGEANMGDPQTLINFANWAISNYPANNYCLIFWDHGEGWKYNSGGDRKGLCDDLTDNDRLTTSEMEEALRIVTGNGVDKLEIIGFDACLMGMIEVAYEIEDYGMYMVASEETEPVTGWNYNSSLDALVKNPMMYPEELGKQFVDSYYGYEITLATIDLGKLNTLVDAADDFSKTVVQDEKYRPVVRYAFENVEVFQDYDFVDLYHFAELCYKYTNDVNIKNAAQNIFNRVETVITSEKHDTYYHTNVHGLSVYLPYYGFDYNYQYLKFAQDTHWDEMIIWLLGSASSRAPSKPSIDGPYTGQINTPLTYSFISEDPDGDPVYYFVDWGYNFETSFIGPTKSGETASGSNTWYFDGGYVIKVMAVDGYGAYSEWSYLTISVPKTRTFTNFLLDKLSNIFSWFERF
jgi:hypothetical protein